MLGGNFRKFGTTLYPISGTFCAFAFWAWAAGDVRIAAIKKLSAGESLRMVALLAGHGVHYMQTGPSKSRGPLLPPLLERLRFRIGGKPGCRKRRSFFHRNPSGVRIRE